MDLGLEGKVALVTGGSRGIGRGVAEILSSEGATVAICARTESVLVGAAEEISAATGNTVLPVTADLTKPADIERVVDVTRSELGRIDFLINNTGSSVFGYFHELTDENWTSGFQLKFFSYVRLSALVVPQMKAQGGGVIVNVVGNAGRTPMAWHMPGGAANSALLNFTKSLSNQVGEDGIRVVALNPGPTETDRWDTVIRFFREHGGASGDEVRQDILERIPMRRFATPEDIGYAVAFLVSDKAYMITGSSLTVDGGMSQSLL